MLDHTAELDRQAAALRHARADLAQALAAMPGIEVFPSAANFLLIHLSNADKVFAGLVQRKILVKNAGKMHPTLHNCLRVNVSTPEENALFLAAFERSLSRPHLGIIFVMSVLP